LKSALARNTEVIEKLEASLREKDERIASLERKLEDKRGRLLNNISAGRVPYIWDPGKQQRGHRPDRHRSRGKVGVNLVVSDIDRESPGWEARPTSAVIVKFVNYRKRREVFTNKKLLKNSGVTLREDLTQSRHALLKDCITRYGSD
ncbi:hypothetical protein ANN_24742, partial [Periplaneta americana]